MPHKKGSPDAAKFGRQGAATRWGSLDNDAPRKTRMSIAVTEDEAAMIRDKARELGMSQATLIVKAVRAYEHDTGGSDIG